MAKLSDLIPAVADSLGLPDKTVAIYARHLREAQLLSTGGRGPGGAEMTPQDCANLLMAIVGGNQAKDAARTVEHYRNLPAGHNGGPNKWTLEGFEVPELITLKEGHSFGAALKALISSAKDGHLQQAMVKACTTEGQDYIPLPPPIDISLQGPLPLARIRISDFDRRWIEEITYVERSPLSNRATREEIESWTGQLGKKHRMGDMIQIRVFTGRTVLDVGELLRS